MINLPPSNFGYGDPADGDCLLCSPAFACVCEALGVDLDEVDEVMKGRT